MPEADKKSLEAMAEALNRVPADKHEQLVNFIEGFAAGATFAQKGEKNAESEKTGPAAVGGR